MTRPCRLNPEKFRARFDDRIAVFFQELPVAGDIVIFTCFQSDVRHVEDVFDPESLGGAFDQGSFHRFPLVTGKGGGLAEIDVGAFHGERQNLVAEQRDFFRLLCVSGEKKSAEGKIFVESEVASLPVRGVDADRNRPFRGADPEMVFRSAADLPKTSFGNIDF